MTVRGGHRGGVTVALLLAAALGVVAGVAWRADLRHGDRAAAQPPDGASQTTSPGSASSASARQPSGGAVGETGASRQRICAWSRGNAASLERAAAAHALDEIDFDWYHSLADGSLRPQGENLKLLARARALQVKAFATITNRLTHTTPFDAGIASAILSTAARRRAHVARLVGLCVTKGFDGIDLDWEDMKAADRARFTAFVQELASKLHASGKLLSIAVYPKTSEPGSWDAQRAEDYARLGAAVDEFKVMTYAFSGGWSKPGPQMPLYWAKQVLAFVTSRVPARKVYMGMPFFGFDWKGSAARYVLWRDVQARRARFGGRLSRDSGSREAVLRYADTAGAAHVVYFQDRAAVRAKTDWMRDKEPGVAGMAIWVMGGEDPGFWPILAAELARR